MASGQPPRRTWFSFDEANGLESVSRPPAVFFAGNCTILFCLYLAGGTPGRYMTHPVYRSPYLRRHVMVQKTAP